MPSRQSHLDRAWRNRTMRCRFGDLGILAVAGRTDALTTCVMVVFATMTVPLCVGSGARPLPAGTTPRITIWTSSPRYAKVESP